VYDEFPFQDAVCYPYWNNAELIQCEPAGVYVTAYERAQEGLLMFVSNLSDQGVDARVTLRQSLHTAWGDCRAVDALSGETVAVASQPIELKLAPWQYRVLRLKPQSKQ
jgi:hypothetical protein